jgi:predicted alpha/beta hydrolase family esterase
MPDIPPGPASPPDGSILILHGLGGSGPDHWQSWLARRIRAREMPVSYPELPDPDRPSLRTWLEVARAAAEASGSESTVVCHSLASLLWIHLAHRSNRRLADRVLLVAPPSEAAVLAEAAEFAPGPLDPVSIAGAARDTRLVCAPRGEDPYCPEGARTLYGPPLNLPVDEIPGGAHLNTDAGYGAWPAIERWCLDRAALPIIGRDR